MSKTTETASGCTVTVGNIVGAFLSYKLNASIGWAIFHFLCGWLYVLYAIFFRSHELGVLFRTMFA